MNDWAALFHSLTADTLDSVDTVSTKHLEMDEVSTVGRNSVNSVQSVNVSERGESMCQSGEKRNLSSRPWWRPSPPWNAAVPTISMPPTGSMPSKMDVGSWCSGERMRSTVADIFGFPPVPENPDPSWRRLARIDQLGLVWLMHGRPVTAIAAGNATIATPAGGSVTFYRLPETPPGSRNCPLASPSIGTEAG
jgi:hypothetical protein